MEDFYYRKLNTYQLAKQLAMSVYSLLNTFPKEENHALVDQLRRAVISVPSNIAEGMGRFAVKDRVRFLEIAYASLMEVMCQIEIAQELHYITDQQFTETEEQIKTVARTMSGLRKSLLEKITN